MRYFKAGDRVKCVGGDKFKIGEIYTVFSTDKSNPCGLMFTIEGKKPTLEEKIACIKNTYINHELIFKNFQLVSPKKSPLPGWF